MASQLLRNSGLLVFGFALAACGPGGPSDPLSRSASGQEHGTGTARGPSSPGAFPLRNAELAPFSTASPGIARQPEQLVMPAWMAKELEHPDRAVRLRALDHWAQAAPPGSVGPLLHALKDKDELVRKRAFALIVQDWAQERKAIER